MRLSQRNNLWIPLAAALLVSGCADIMSREDSITARVGNAPQANAYIQTIDHWPSNAGNVQVSGN